MGQREMIRETFEDVTNGVINLETAVSTVLENDMAAVQRRQSVVSRAQDARRLAQGRPTYFGRQTRPVTDG